MISWFKTTKSVGLGSEEASEFGAAEFRVERDGITHSLAAAWISVAVVTLHQAGQGVQKGFGTVERVYVQLRFIVGTLVVGIKNYRRHVEGMAFRAHQAALRYRHGVGNNNSADMADTQDFKRSFS